MAARMRRWARRHQPRLVTGGAAAAAVGIIAAGGAGHGRLDRESEPTPGACRGRARAGPGCRGNKLLGLEFSEGRPGRRRGAMSPRPGEILRRCGQRPERPPEDAVKHARLALERRRRHLSRSRYGRRKPRYFRAGIGDSPTGPGRSTSRYPFFDERQRRRVLRRQSVRPLHRAPRAGVKRPPGQARRPIITIHSPR